MIDLSFLTPMDIKGFQAMPIKTGLYEQVINAEFENGLKNVKSETVKLNQAEAPKILSLYLAEIIEKGLIKIQEKSEDKDGVTPQLVFVNRLVNAISETAEDSLFPEDNDEAAATATTKAQAATFDDFQKYEVIEPGRQLLEVIPPQSISNAETPRPVTSLSRSTLFTGGGVGPQMMSELKKEILSADRIDMLVSFIRCSGLNQLIENLRAFTERGGVLRVITTSYMGATQFKAIDDLSKLPNTQIKVSYDTDTTRLHAKAYVFYRKTGFSTAYIGSSNVSAPALLTGHEWNLKITRHDQPDTFKQIEASFDNYWNSSDFETYTNDSASAERLRKALEYQKGPKKDDKTGLPLFEITPRVYQKVILDNLEAERTVHGHWRNLIVAATGTGKTIISALDYRNFYHKNPRNNRLLFIVHREEILHQALATFRMILRDPNFGELWTGNERPENINQSNLVQKIGHLFMTIQSFNSRSFIESVPPDFYDFIIVDEFHHAAAKSYQNLLSHFKPKILVGLTATPERCDGEDILHFFDNRIAAEIRLPEAIERQYLCPFQYFGITDTVDLDKVAWNVRGYDTTALSKLYVADTVAAQSRIQLIIESLERYVADIRDVKGVGFCVTVEHAKIMAAAFNQHGIPSICLTGQSDREERRTAQQRLTSGEIQFIFVVDIYNEGVDIPCINTILFLRPTQSLAIFLQQLGRGLRKADKKDCLTVLDFIGAANKHYDFESKFQALLSNTQKPLIEEIKSGFINVPSGCYIQLEKKAQETVLKNIRDAYGNANGRLTAKYWCEQIERYSQTQADQSPLTVQGFFNWSKVPPEQLYKKRTNTLTFCGLLGYLEKIPAVKDPDEKLFQKLFQRILRVNSARWLRFLIQWLPNVRKAANTPLDGNELTWAQMFHISAFDRVADTTDAVPFAELSDLLRNNPHYCDELMSILALNLDRLNFVSEPQEGTALDCHCNYTRDQLAVALGFMKPQNWREGVKWLPDVKTDILLITLNKSDKDYSPTTMYNDYSINDRRFHWQSQSTTGEESKTGLRYQNHEKNGSKVMLFVRNYKTDPELGVGSSYTLLGTAKYVNHEGSEPMNVIWELDRAIPGQFLQQTSHGMID